MCLSKCHIKNCIIRSAFVFRRVLAFWDCENSTLLHVLHLDWLLVPSRLSSRATSLAALRFLFKFSPREAPTCVARYCYENVCPFVRPSVYPSATYGRRCESAGTASSGGEFHFQTVRQGFVLLFVLHGSFLFLNSLQCTSQAAR